MPQITSNFIFRSKSPNFERDSFKTFDEMINIPSSYMDEGHISFCEENGNHYIFKSANGQIGKDRWVQLTYPNIKDLENLPFIKQNIYVVDKFTDLTDTLARQLNQGDLVFVKQALSDDEDYNDHKIYYYNTYNSKDGIQSVDYQEGISGWFRQLIPDANNAVTKEELNEEFIKQGFVTKATLEQYQYATKSDISNLATKGELSGYASEEFVTNNYPTKSDLNDVKNEITSSLGNFVDSTRLESYATKSDIEQLATKTDIDDLQHNVDNKVLNLVSNENLDEKLSNYISKSEFPTIENSVTEEELVAALEPYAKKTDLNDYALKSEIPTIENSVTKDDLKPLENQIATISAATGSIQQSLDSFKEEVKDEYATHEYLDGHYVKGETFQNNVSITNTRLSNLEEQSEGNKQSLDSFKEEVENVYSTKSDLEEHISDFEAYKEEVEKTYAKPEDISSKLNTYAPSIEHQNRWVGSEYAGNLAGKTGKDIAKEAYSYNAVLDQMLFGEFTPTISTPSVNIELKENWNNEVSIDWYDKDKRIILVKAGSAGPDGADFFATNIKDAIITYPKGIDLASNFTNGLIPSTDEKQVSVGFCKVKDEDGNWEYYKKDNNIYHVPAILEEGEYRYYMAAYFQKGSPAINNDGLTIDEWNENFAVESEDYITIIASKPTYYNTKDGFAENPLQILKDNTEDYIELEPSCILDQSFKLPHKIKQLCIWNGLGGYAPVPMVYQKDDKGVLTENLVPAYFNESIDENGYYTYIYDSNENGHRGAIKIKVTF